MFRFSRAAKWLRMKWVRDFYRRYFVRPAGDPRPRCVPLAFWNLAAARKARPALLRPTVEMLEDRTLLSVSISTGTNSIDIKGNQPPGAVSSNTLPNTDTVYLTQTGTTLSYSTDNTNYASIAMPGGTSLTVENVSNVVVHTSLYTGGGALTFNTLNGVSVDNAATVIGDPSNPGGHLTGNGDTFAISAIDSSTNVLTLNRQSGTAALTAGQLLTFSNSGSNGGLTDGEQYAVHVVDQSTPSVILVQLYQPLVLSTSPYVLGEPAHPAGTLSHSGNTYTITKNDAATDTLTVSGTTALTEGQSLAFSNSGNASGSLNDGTSYTVHVVDQTDLGHIRIQLLSTSATAGNITFQGSRALFPGQALANAPAPTITVGSYDQIIAKGPSSSKDGTIMATTSDTIQDTGVLAYDNLYGFASGNYTGRVSIGQGAVISGGSVTLSSTTGDVSALNSVHNVTGADIAQGLLSWREDCSTT